MDSRVDPAASALAVTLEKLKYAELREIARCRGWRVSGSSKAEYAQGLVPLLCDTTEVARLVLSLPRHLREGLRAAFIVETGAGVTPAALARTLDGIGGHGPGSVKPVEALALLEDLSRLGLLFPWRDLATGPRFLFPSEVQRAVPPLPGWCPCLRSALLPAAEGGSAGVLPSLLHQVWSLIARQPAQLSASPKLDIDKRLRAAVGDWPIDQSELEAWRTQPGAYKRLPATLVLPASPYMLADQDMHALVSLTGAGDELLELALRVLEEMSLFSRVDGRLQAQGEGQVELFSRDKCGQRAEAVRAFLSLLEWGELDMLLRSDTRLVVMRAIQPAHSFAQFRARLRGLRHQLLRFLASASAGRWCSFEAVSDALRVAWPAILPESAQDDPANSRPNGLRPPWFLAWRDTGKPLRMAEPDDWQAGPGQLLSRLVQGPLHWLGLAECTFRQEQLVAFRTSGLGDLLWNRGRAPAPQPTWDGAVAVDEKDLTVTAHIGPLPPEVAIMLAQLASVIHVSGTEFKFRLDMRTAYSSFARSSLSELIDDWHQVMPIPVPESWQQQLSEWWRRYGRIHLYEGLAVLEVKDDFTLRELEATTSLEEQIIARLSPRLVVISERSADMLLSQLSEKGYMPDEECHQDR